MAVGDTKPGSIKFDLAGLRMNPKLDGAEEWIKIVWGPCASSTAAADNYKSSQTLSQKGIYD